MKKIKFILILLVSLFLLQSCGAVDKSASIYISELLIKQNPMYISEDHVLYRFPNE